MKKMWMVWTVIICLLLSGCSYGDVSETEITIGASEIYTEADIAAAMDVVKAAFRDDFGDCVLTKLSYQEEVSLREQEYWSDRYKGAQIIVLLSEFTVNEECKNPSLNAGSTYTSWMWVLIRNDGADSWVLKNWGVA